MNPATESIVGRLVSAVEYGSDRMGYTDLVQEAKAHLTAMKTRDALVIPTKIRPSDWDKSVILEDLKTALDWIADGDDKEGHDLIVGPLREKHFGADIHH